MPLLGSHLSVAGGCYKAVEEAARLHMDTVQIFTKNNNQWACKPLTDSDIAAFQQALSSTGIRAPAAHASYLINLASPDDVLWQKSVAALEVELLRAEAFGLLGLVLHPGSHTTSTEDEGLARVAQALNLAHSRTPGLKTLTLLENTAGQGSNLGHRFEHLALILSQAADRQRLGVCLDTCHLFAAGYPLGSAREYQTTLAEFDRLIGLERVCAWHLNDSAKPFGSRVDRHAHIGRGCIGQEAFGHLLNDRRWAATPMYLETEKGEEDGEQLDAINLRTLRSLLKPATRRRK